MRLSLPFSTLAIAGFGLILGPASVQADSFSWANITYAPTPTVAAQTTSLGAGGGTNMLSIQFALNNGATFLPTATVQSPTVDSYNTNNTYYASGGNSATEKYLQVGVNMVNSTNGIGSVTVNLFFAKPITNAQFSFFDVDINSANATGQYVDQIRSIVGTAVNGSPVYLSSLTGSADNTVSGTTSTASAYAVTANANNVNNLAAANATATFGATPITEISYTYGDAYTGTGTHGTAQITALSDFTFTTVPEPGTTAMMALGAIGAGLIAFRRRRA